MTTEIAICLIIFAIALVLFFFEWIAADIVALGIMLALIITGLLTPEEAFAGFGSPTALMILGLLIMTAALTRTGVVDIAGRWIVQRAGSSPGRVSTILIIGSSIIGAFMSNTASTAFFLPVTLGIARRAKISPAKLLMPLAFGSILSSSITLVSTSTNLIVDGLMRQYGLQPLGMFELTPVGLPIMVVGLGYMLTVGRRLIPDRTGISTEDTLFATRLYLTEAMITPDSPLIGKKLADTPFGRDLDITVFQIVRDKTEYIRPNANVELKQSDVLLVQGERSELLRIKETPGIEIKADVKLRNTSLEEGQPEVVEVIVLPRSPLIGRTLKGYRFRERYNMQVLAINRSGETIRSKISRVVIKMGDVLLIQGERDQLKQLETNNHFRVLDVIERITPNTQRAYIAAGIFVLALGLATVNLLPISVAVVLGAFLAFLTRCITPEEAYREVEWKALILIGSMLAFGTAMQQSGTADYLADQIVNAVGTSSPTMLLSLFFVLTVLLTQPMSNQAAAVVVVPIAIQTAVRVNLDPRPFAIMIAVAASCSYLTPLEPSCIMVYGPGQYKFFDFVKVGSLLTLLIFGLAIMLVPMIWPV